MASESFKTLIGIQGGVMGWDDPWHPELCKKFARTGERQYFASQDATPPVDEFIKFIKELGVDFYMHHVMPEPDEINSFIDSMANYDMNFIMANEYGNINRFKTSGTNRYDIPEECVKKAVQTGRFMGLLYDESEHLQLHPFMYSSINIHEDALKSFDQQWANTDGKNLQEIEDSVVEAVKKRICDYGGNVSLFSEHVFPVMYHAFARGGFNPCPKVLKEEFQSLQLSSALGAAKQYGRKMGICVDLWGPDAGHWFTRIWGFPGHCPAEYKSGLELAYLMGPDFLFTENIDPLAYYKQGRFSRTEFGDIFEEFIKKFIPSRPRPYNHTMVEADIAIIRSDDSDISIYGSMGGRGLYGSLELKGDEKTQSVFKVFNLLSHGTIPDNGITYFLPQFRFPAGNYQRTPENISKLPLVKGVSDCNEYSHTMFYPMRNAVVFDERVTSEALGNPGLIILAGSRMTSQCLKAVAERVRDGATCIAAGWLMPEGMNNSRKDGQGKWIITENFCDDLVKEAVKLYVGSEKCWSQRFGNHEVRFYNPSGDGVTLEHEII